MPPLPSPARRTLRLKSSDLRGLARLSVDGTVGVTDLVEAMHHTIASGVVRSARTTTGRTGGLTGLVYGAVRGTTRWVGRGLDAGLRKVDRPVSAHAGSPQREAFVAVLNGIWGDHLDHSANPLALPMALRQGGVALDFSTEPLSLPQGAPTGKLLVLAHGLCMNDLQWARNGRDHGQALGRQLGATPLYLHYNSGRHVSSNGRDFATLLQQLVTRWPVPVQELWIVGHSMGGLVARSACHHAAAEGHGWLKLLRKLVFLGTPHHGAPLERGGRWIDLLLGLSPYVAPFDRLGKTRSAGITDLRFGNLQDADWTHRSRHTQQHDDRQPTPLPEGVDVYALAATLSERPGRLHRAVVGDGLVPLASALGEHSNPALALHLPASHRHIVSACGHLDLLGRAEVGEQLSIWLSAHEQRRATDDAPCAIAQ